jgi:hypothetical protein
VKSGERKTASPGAAFLSGQFVADHVLRLSKPAKAGIEPESSGPSTNLRKSLIRDLPF